MTKTETDKLVKDHIGYIKKMANKYGNSNNKEDLVNEGVIGLLIAAQRYDESHEVKFLTYASHWIYKYMVMYLKDQSKYVPSKEKTDGYNLVDEEMSMESQTEVSHITEKITREMLKENCTERDLHIIKARYLNSDPETLQTLADNYGVSRERIRQIEGKWINFIKEKLEI